MGSRFVAGNWKMHGTSTQVETLLAALAAGAPPPGRGTVVVFPPFVYLERARRCLAGTPVALGAQNLSHNPPGAHTGEVAAEMLLDVGCRYVIVGHSERRQHQGEDDGQVAEKFAVARAAGLIPVLCIGETAAQRSAGETQAVLIRQLEAVLQRVGVTDLVKGVLAYEPVWAIGTGNTATPDQAQEIHGFLRRYLATLDASGAVELSIVYGGSVKAANAAALFAEADIDGALVGGASLEADEFLAIAHAP
ncbi:MAG: triose-phosphate isomerase [Candidatus Competibacterales bacterium]